MNFYQIFASVSLVNPNQSMHRSLRDFSLSCILILASKYPFSYFFDDSPNCQFVNDKRTCNFEMVVMSQMRSSYYSADFAG